MARKSRKNAAETVKTATVTAAYQAAAYVRLSSDDKRKRGDSIETQQAIISNYLALASDVTLRETYIDNSMTGTNFARPAFQKMLADCESGRINCIIVKDLSRFGRNMLDTGYYLQRYLPSLGVRVIAINDGFDSIESDGGILLPLKNMINEAYALDIGRKCRAVQQQYIESGAFVGSLPPYGYLKDPQDCHRLVIDPETAPNVRQIFEWAADGIVKVEIVRRLNDAGITSPGHYKREKGFIRDERLIGKGFWQIRMLTNLLSDMVYCGDLVQGKDRQYNNKRIDIPREDWITVRNTHEPIVSRELFAAANNALDRAAKAETDKRGAKTPYAPNVFKSKVFCGHCGHAMHYHRSKTVYWFHCVSQSVLGRTTCVQVSLKSADLKASVLALLQKHTEVITGKYLELRRNPALSDGGDAALKSELTAIRQELEKNRNFMRSLYESLVTAVITPDEFSDMKQSYESKIAALTSRADALQNERRELQRQLDEYRELSERVNSVECESDLTAELVDALIEKICVYRDKSFEVHFRFKDEFGEVRQCANM
ncbi:MAG: recombinase family protein [Oscillospiraceae bacterium]|jgi:DNA invertase Pin-like site-specific DNA recombinase|nr:recombinase family protein [Oscillospiraceae bacterium]